MSLRAQVLKGFWWVAGGAFLQQLFTWAITIVIVRLLSPADYGLLAMATVFTSFLALFAELGLGPALVQAPDIDEGELRRALGLVLLMNGSLCALLVLGAPLVAAFYGEERLTLIICVLSLQFLLGAFGVVPGVVLKRRLDFKRGAIVGLVSGVLSSVLTLVLALAGFGVWALVWGSTAGAAFRVIGVNLVAPFLRWPEFSFRGTRRLMFFGGNITLSRLLWFVNSQSDVIIAGKLLGKEALGYYSVSMDLASLPVTKVSSVIHNVTFPAFARIQHDPALVASHVLKGVRLLSFASFPVFLGIFSVAPELVRALLGPKWEPAILPLQLLSLTMPVRMIYNFLHNPLEGVGHPEIVTINLAWATMIMPVAFFVGAQWGLLGLSVAWLIALPIVFCWNLPRSLRALNLRVRALLGAVALPALLSVIMCSAVLAAGAYLPSGGGEVFALLILVAVGVLSYAILVAVFDRTGARELIGLLKP